MQQEGEISLW